jgi:putative ABC transport system ATP-binding protein
MQKPNPASGPAVVLSGVNLSLGQGAARVHILKDISLDIDRGEAIGLVGPSGSGKSTLLMVLAGLERADHGSIVVAGQDLTKLSRMRWRAFAVAMLASFFSPFI